MWGNKASSSVGLLGSGFFRDVVAPILLICGTNVFLALLLSAMTQHDWCVDAVARALLADPAAFFLGAFRLPSATALRILGVFAGFELALMRLVPGAVFRGPVSAGGNVPVYTANGFQCFLITLASYLAGAYWFRAFDPSVVYDHYPEMLTALTLASMVLCLILTLKGLYAPSSSDASTTGSFVMDYYWGTELYPRILGWDVKMFTNCRFGMMAWVLLPLVCAHKSQAVHGVLSPALMANVALQLIYCAKVRGEGGAGRGGGGAGAGAA